MVIDAAIQEFCSCLIKLHHIKRLTISAKNTHTSDESARLFIELADKIDLKLKKLELLIDQTGMSQ